MTSRVFSLIALCAALASAQIVSTPSETAEQGLPRGFHCGGRPDLGMDRRDKVCYWWTHSFNAPMVSGAAFNAAMDQWVKNSTNDEWGQGFAGFGRRFGTRLTQSMAKGTGQALGGLLLKEDPRLYASHRKGFGPRLAFALTRTFIVRVNCDPELGASCKERLSIGRLGGAFASGFVGMAWTPDRINTTNRALVRSGTAMTGVMLGSLWKEFQPDITKLASRIVRRPPKETAPPAVPIGSKTKRKKQ